MSLLLSIASLNEGSSIKLLQIYKFSCINFVYVVVYMVRVMVGYTLDLSFSHNVQLQ